jgi:CheY-like chemotaxis protein
MNRDNTKIVIAEDDENHALLIRKNLERVQLKNEIIHFYNGEDVLDYFFSTLEKPLDEQSGHILLLDIKMPRVDGVEVLKTMKEHPLLKKVPIIIMTTTDNPDEINLCHKYGCNSYIIKPVNYEKFMEVVNLLGTFLKIIKVPNILK